MSPSPRRDVIVEEHRRIDDFFCQEIRTKNSGVKVSEQESFSLYCSSKLKGRKYARQGRDQSILK
jgi:hypothetical protein